MLFARPFASHLVEKSLNDRRLLSDQFMRQGKYCGKIVTFRCDDVKTRGEYFVSKNFSEVTVKISGL